GFAIGVDLAEAVVAEAGQGAGVGPAVFVGREGGAVANRLVIAAGGSLDVSTITFIKSGATISGGFYTRCNLSVDNQTDLTINTDAIINGNLLVQPGNPTLRGAGTLLVRGCCAGSVGAINGLNQAPATLSVCIQDNAANRDACGTAGQTCSSSLPTSLQGCSSFTVLPVELAAFSARYAPEQASVWLHWLTASEENNDRFEIQRSPDGRTFHTLARVAGHGTTLTPHEYRWSDTRPLPGLSYYRLRQVDADGKAAFSEVITATAAAEPTAQVWPSEISGHYHVRVAQPTDAAALLQVFSPLGRLVRSASLRTTDPQELSLQDLPAGTYTLRIVTGSQVFTHRLLHPQP
ncbi:MAG TPA: T9SS type A sorting domain-containing protein, partial [bacterium]|nr:T9SS type A sorting domain-containing protein [bacterium]